MSCQGFIAGMTGMGAGLVIVPILLLLGIHTRVASATSGFMYFFISFSAIVTTIIEGYISWDMLLLYIGLAFIGGLLVSKLVYFLVNKYQVHSVIVFIVFGLAFLNLLSIIAYITIKVNKKNGWELLIKFNKYC